MLIVGDDNGDLFRVLPASGVVTKINSSKGRGPVVALATADVAKLAYVTDGKAVYDASGWASTTAKPIYSAVNETILDLAYSRWTRGGVIHFGNGCSGPGGAPRMVFGDYPTQGNKAHQIKMTGGPANAAALLFLGLSRQLWGTKPLPLGLGFLGAGGCNLNVSPDVALGLKTDGNGAISFPALVPNNASLVGVHAMAQFALNDKGANVANITATDALELVIR
jgi:hypothetical protein